MVPGPAPARAGGFPDVKNETSASGRVLCADDGGREFGVSPASLLMRAAFPSLEYPTMRRSLQRALS